MGTHVAEYMEMLEEEDPTKYEAHFAKFIAAGVNGGGVADMYSKAHESIKKNPEHKPKKKEEVKNVRKGKMIDCAGKTYQRNVKLTLKQRKEKVKQKIARAQAKMLAAAEEELTQAKTDLDQTNKEILGLHETETDLHESCDYILKNFFVRQQARSAEIDALGEAKAILSGMK